MKKEFDKMCEMCYTISPLLSDSSDFMADKQSQVFTSLFSSLLAPDKNQIDLCLRRAQKTAMRQTLLRAEKKPVDLMFDVKTIYWV